MCTQVTFDLKAQLAALWRAQLPLTAGPDLHGIHPSEARTVIDVRIAAWMLDPDAAYISDNPTRRASSIASALNLCSCQQCFADAGSQGKIKTVFLQSCVCSLKNFEKLLVNESVYE